MDRRFVALLILLAVAFSAQAQTPSPTPLPPGPPDDPGLPRRFQDEGPRRQDGPRQKDDDRRERRQDADRRHRDKDDPDWLKKKLERMNPEERRRFLENYEKWKKLPPEERDKLRGDRKRGEFVRRAVGEALEKTGLKLSPADQEAFAMRYREERRKLEEKLREELERKRQELLPEMLERLKSEFSSRNQSGQTTTPTTPPASTGDTGS